MFRSRTNNSSSTSLAKAARELERQMMTMEVVSGDEGEGAASPTQVELPNRLAFGPYGIAPLSGLHFDNPKDTAAS